MSPKSISIYFVAVFCTMLSYSAGRKEPVILNEFVTSLSTDTDKFVVAFEGLGKAIRMLANNNPSKDTLQRSFETARTTYKQIEFVFEYYYPEAVKLLNGPLVTKVDLYDKEKVYEPEGMQVLEEMIYSDSVYAHKEDLIREFERTYPVLKSLKTDVKLLKTTESQIFEMMRLEIIRIMALGITGADATTSLHSIPETIPCIKSIKQCSNLFKNHYPSKGVSQYTKLITLCDGAIQYARSNTDFNTFNRIQYTKKFLNPISEILLAYQQSLQIGFLTIPSAFNFKSKHIFDKQSLNASSFALIDATDTLHAYNQAQLGKLLFFEPALSKNGDRSCASCHNPQKAFTDGVSKSVALGFKGTIARNAPSIINSVFQKAIFYDGRVSFLEHQVVDVISNPNELHGNIEEIVPVLRQSTEYVRLFKKCFKNTQDTAITVRAVSRALAQYENTLVGMNSRFDRFMRGEKVPYTVSEINGYTLFSGKGKCATCHFPPLFNGVVPPNFQEHEFEVIGVPQSKESKEVDSDLGRYGNTGIEQYKHAFKTPTVRNIALTAPYMHNGVYNTLEEVMEFYNKGGGKGMSHPIDNLTLPFDSLQLTPKEIKDVIAFMRSLTDTTGTTSKPHRLPVFEKGVSNSRKIGGTY